MVLVNVSWSSQKYFLTFFLQVDLPLQLCSHDEADQFLPTIIAALEQRRVTSAPNDIEVEQGQRSQANRDLHTNALTNLSDYWVLQRWQWPQLLHSFAGLPCVDGAIALAFQENDTGLALAHRVFSSDQLQCVFVCTPSFVM